MSVPANFKAAIRSKDVKVRRWLEIEGIPYAYGTFSQVASFFNARDAAARFLGVRAQLVDIPRNLDQTVDTLDGGALTTGQTDFEIADNDGEPTRWTGVGLQTGLLTLNGDHNAAATTFNFFGPVAAFTGSGLYEVGGYFYIGTETIKIGGISGQTFTGCTRGMFRSKPQIWGSGTPALYRAYTMANRRCWYNEVAVSVLAGMLLSSTDPDRCVRFAGACRSLKLRDDTFGSYILTAESMDRELDRNCFRTLRKFSLVGNSISDADGNNGNTQVPGYPDFTAGHNLLYNFSLIDFPTVPEFFLLKIENEIFQAARVAGSGLIPACIALTARGLFGTKIDSHKEGSICQEIVSVARYAVNEGPQNIASHFSSVATVGSPLDTNHPLLLMLQILLSTGAGTNTAGGSTRNYDVLPEGWGMDVDYSRVDIAAVEAAAMEEPTLKFSGIIFEPQNFVALLRDTLRMCGYYYLITIGDKFTIRRLRPPLPDVATTSIGQSNRIRKFFTKWEANWSGAIRELIFKYGWDINENRYKRIDVLISDTGDIYSKGLARSLTFESKLLYPGGSGIAGEMERDTFDVDAWLLTRKDFYRTRYGIPPPIIRERLDYSFLDTEIGDIVDVTHPNLPDPSTGTRGLTASIGEVIGKSIDDKSKTVDFTILMTGWKLGQYRFIAPALRITSQDDSENLFADVNQFSEPNGPFFAGEQNDAQLEASNGDIKDIYATDSPCWMWTEDFSHHQACTIQADFGHLTVDGLSNPAIAVAVAPDGGTWDAEFGPSGPTSDGSVCYLTHRDYQTVKDSGITPSNETPTAKYAFGSTSALGTDEDAPHKYFPL